MRGTRLPDPARAAAAIEQFLDALSLPPGVRAGADLAGTGRRVADAWLEDLLDGYRRQPAEVLAGAMPSRSRDLVAVTGVDYHSICPHHLLPSRGVAHVAYVPGGRVAGFGQLVKLVDALAHRLVLEEDLARAVVDALVRDLGARGAACVLEAEHLCMTVRGERRVGARAHAQAFAGVLAEDARLQRRFLAAVAGTPHPSLSPRSGERVTARGSPRNGERVTARGSPRSGERVTQGGAPARPRRKARVTQGGARGKPRRAGR